MLCSSKAYRCICVDSNSYFGLFKINKLYKCLVLLGQEQILMYLKIFIFWVTLPRRLEFSLRQALMQLGLALNCCPSCAHFPGVGLLLCATTSGFISKQCWTSYPGFVQARQALCQPSCLLAFENVPCMINIRGHPLVRSTPELLILSNQNPAPLINLSPLSPIITCLLSASVTAPASYSTRGR